MSEANPRAGVAAGPAEGTTGGPEGGLEGRAPEGTAGPSPAAGEAATRTAQRYRYKMPYRYTGMGGLDYAIAICQTCREVVKPVGGRRSRTGNHGEDYYEHEHPLSFLVLVRSNSGNRSHYTAGEPVTDGAIRNAIEMAIDNWEWYGAHHTEVRYYLKEALRNLPGR